ncbi:hypothetical protein [Sphingomonas sp. Leaf10]|uniref:hypothetical protein n=1 Tax=Sphingomonas sp. Leaf10 TaxID=1735676 RepID=UPI001F37AB7C|nr:hypothetical protein [Sphingomonas sp. Leaf10]
MRNAEEAYTTMADAPMTAPLIAGNDVATMSQATRDILLNREVIAVDQDPLGQQGRRVARDGTSEVWVKPTADGGRVLLLWNRGDAPARISAEWTALGLSASVRLKARDLWAHRDLGPLAWETQRRMGLLCASAPLREPFCGYPDRAAGGPSLRWGDDCGQRRFHTSDRASIALPIAAAIFASSVRSGW